jgi:hypothetical protein
MGGKGHLACLVASLILATLAVYVDQRVLGSAWAWGQYASDFAICWGCLYALILTAAAATLEAPCSRKRNASFTL